ncbi:MAG TPA: GNAT family N-acetyltransferase [Alphaproteobacteria bacterium]|nr:GNAT family N-acetyltransferase [Alphaproteobacteria bacterium]
MTADFVRLLERLGAATWPAEHEEEISGWRLGFTSGVTRRANSVLPLDWTGGDLDAAVSEAEARYRARGLAPCFKLTFAALPEGLEGLLADRGYRAAGRSRVMTADAAAMARACTPAYEVGLAAGPDPVWRAVVWPSDEVPAAEEAVRAGIVGRIPTPRAFVTVVLDDRPAGTALGAVADGWGCVTAVHTLPAFRRRGVARAALGALAGWTAGQGATGLFLQVEADNAAAIALYEAAGFRWAYDYHYRVLD